MRNTIECLKFDLQHYRFEFKAPNTFRTSNGNALRSSRGIISSQLMESLTNDEMSSLDNSKCKGNKSTMQSFVERLIMTDVELLQLMYHYNKQNSFSMPIDLLENYMNVCNSIHMKIIQLLSRYGYIQVLSFNGESIVISVTDLLTNTYWIRYEDFMVPGNPKINVYIQRISDNLVPSFNIAQLESKSLF